MVDAPDGARELGADAATAVRVYGPMSTRLTYTSGALGGETDAEFEARLAEARADASEPLPHLVGGEDDPAGERSAARPRRATEPWRVAPTRARPSSSPRRRAARAARAGLAARCRTASAASSCARWPRGIGERHLELAAVASLETGKTRTESILEVQEAVDLITTYAELMERNKGYAAAARAASSRASEHRTSCGPTACSR